MSQIQLRARAGSEDVTHVVIGWDPPLETYFVQVHGADEDNLILWLGTRLRHLDIDQALEAAGRYAILPRNLRARLLKDRADNPALPPTPFQQAMRQAFGDPAF